MKKVLPLFPSTYHDGKWQFIEHATACVSPSSQLDECKKYQDTSDEARYDD